MEEWKECTLSDIGTIVGGATPSTKDSSNYENGSIAWITPKDLSTHSGRYISHGERNITDKGLKSCSAQMMPKNSILFTSRAPIGYIAIAQNEVCTNQGFKSVVPNECTDFMFLYYLLKYNKENIENLGSGTTFKEVSGSTMQKVPVKVPSLTTQTKIAAILSSIDDKIELNNKINDNLEQQIITYFNHYIMDTSQRLDFETKELSEVTTNLRDRITDNTTPVFSAVNTGNLQRSDDYFSKQVYSKDIGKYILVKIGDFAYNPARINIGSIGLNDLDYDGCVSPVYVAFSVDKDYRSFFKYYFKSNNFKEETKLRASGSVRQSLNYSDFAKIQIKYPSRELAKDFEEFHTNIEKAKKKITKENEVLISIRDTLLPKLMSGEVDVDSVQH